jgi:hypothetical protein
MVLLSNCQRLLRGLIVWLAALLAAQAAVPLAPNSPMETLPQPAVLAFAASHGIRVDGLKLTATSFEGAAGDAVTALVTLREGHRSRQWLVQFTISALTEKERAVIRHGNFVLTADTTHSYKYSADASTALDILVAGPFASGHPPPETETHARALISPDYLSLGLDSFCRVALRLAKENPAVPGAPSLPPAENPFFKLPPRAQWAFLGLFPALGAFMDGIQGTPGLKDILWEIAAKPSVWSIVKSAGKVNININAGNDVTAVDPADWSLPRIPLYRLPLHLSINQQPMLDCILFVTAPRPPLLATAGIVGIIAQPPGKQDKRLDIRMLAAHLAAPAVAGP